MRELKHIYEVRPRKDKRGFDLISDALPFGGLWYAGRPVLVPPVVLFERADCPLALPQ
jgi:hypothetical protein